MDGGGVFVNYRVGDEENTAAFVASRLMEQFGAAYVFRASTSIDPGDLFDKKILAAVRSSAVLLAIIGPRWIGADDERGRRRLDQDDDWVRREIAEAIAHDVRVIPVLVGSAKMPAEEDLPDEIRGLAKRQYLRLHYRSVDVDLSRLVDELMVVAPELAAVCRRRMPDAGIPVNPALVARLSHQSLADGFGSLWARLMLALSVAEDAEAPLPFGQGEVSAASARACRDDLNRLQEDLQPYADRPELVTSADNSFRRRLARLRATLEAVFQQRIAFDGERREHGNERIDVTQIAGILGERARMTGIRDTAGRVTNASVFQHGDEVRGEIVGFTNEAP